MRRYLRFYIYSLIGSYKILTYIKVTLDKIVLSIFLRDFLISGPNTEARLMA